MAAIRSLEVKNDFERRLDAIFADVNKVKEVNKPNHEYSLQDTFDLLAYRALYLGIKIAVIFWLEKKPINLKPFFDPERKASEDNECSIYFKIIIRALITEITNCGNCHEQAHLAAWKILLAGFNKRLEVRSFEGLNFDYKTVKHCYVLLDREGKNNNGRLFDTWAFEQIKPYTGVIKLFSDIFTMRWFTEDAELDIDKNLIAEEWKAIRFFMIGLKELLKDVDNLALIIEKTKEDFATEAKKNREKTIRNDEQDVSSLLENYNETFFMNIIGKIEKKLEEYINFVNQNYLEMDHSKAHNNKFFTNPRSSNQSNAAVDKKQSPIKTTLCVIL